MDPVLLFTLLVVFQNLYWRSPLVLAPEVFYSSRADPSVSLENAQPTSFLFPAVLIAILATPPPKTMTKEWQEASNERARELNLDPITGKWTYYSVPLSPVDSVLILCSL